jgi:hypothetical protein
VGSNIHEAPDGTRTPGDPIHNAPPKWKDLWLLLIVRYIMHRETTEFKRRSLFMSSILLRRQADEANSTPVWYAPIQQ